MALIWIAPSNLNKQFNYFMRHSYVVVYPVLVIKIRSLDCVFEDAHSHQHINRLSPFHADNKIQHLFKNFKSHLSV